MTSVKMPPRSRNQTLICLLVLLKASAGADGDRPPIERGVGTFETSDQGQVFKQFGVWWPKVSPDEDAHEGQEGGRSSPRTITRRSLSTDFRPEPPSWLPGPANNNHHHHHHLHHLHQQNRHEQASNLQPPDYKIITTCEGNQAELRCENDRRIHLVRAVYGRFSLAICNEQGYSNYSVNCARFQVFLQIETRCNNLTACNVPVSTELFGEPCEGTTKYLEVQYSCNDANNQTNNNRLPSPALPTPPPAGAHQAAAPSNSHKSHPPADHSSALVVGGGISNQVGQPPPPSAPTTPKTLESSNTGFSPDHHQAGFSPPNDAGTSGGNFDSANTAPPPPPTAANRQQQTVIQRQHRFCPPQTSSRNVSWNFTRAGQVAHRPCPDGSSGASASWTCDPERLRFVPLLSPDFSQCRSIWLARLNRELDEMLEVSPGRQQQYSMGARQQDLQMFRSILSELSILARERKVFSGDLRSIVIMISQMITQLRSYAVQSGLESPAQFGWTSSSAAAAALAHDGRGQHTQPNSPLLNIYGELFSGLAGICSSLFDPLQRNAWLELESDETRRSLETRLLSHLKEAGLLFVRSLTPDQVADMQPIRQANIIASISVITNNQLRPPAMLSSGAHPPMDRTNELNPFGRPFEGGNNAPLSAQADEVGGNSAEFRLQPQLVSELASNGISKFLVLDIKKPDYSLMRAQLEQQLESQSISPDFGQNLAVDQAQFQKRIFGLFAINENGESLDVAPLSSSRLQQDSFRQRLGELLAQWPVSVEFRVSPLESRLTTNAGSFNLQAAAAHCQSLSSDATSNDLTDDGQANSNGCHLARHNATNFVCSCDKFGFVALAQFAGPRIDILGDDPNMIIGGVSSAGQPNLTQQGQSKSHSRQSLGIVAYVFVVVGLSLLVISGAGLIIKFIGHARLNKKQRGLFESLRNGPTTGPLAAANHNLMGSDQLVSGAATTQSASIIGLSSGVCTSGSNYKTHQQLYSSQMGAHYANSHDSRAWPSRLFGWLLERPSSWISSLTSAGQPHGAHHAGKTDRIDVQHSIIGGNSSTIGTLAYSKSQYQNGYTTSLGLHNPIQQHQTLIRANLGGSQSAVPLNPSSNSSYVSSSAYYEEIGSGNMTKVNANQLSGGGQPQQQDLFMMKQRQQYLDAQNAQSVTHHHHHHPHLNTHHHQHTFHHWQTQTPVGVANGHQQPNTMMTKQQHLHNDLSLLQSSSSSSASSQHSTSTNGQQQPPPPLPSGGATTPRHLLFASPIAVNAYKQQQQQQQQQLRGGHYSHNQ